MYTDSVAGLRDGRHTEHSPTRRRPLRFGVVALLYLGANLFYLLSLRGTTDPDDMESIQGYIGLSLMLSVCFVTAQFWICLGTPYALRSSLLLAVTILCWYLFDNGNRLASHGAYNMLMFFMAFVPINIFVATFQCWWWLAKGSEKSSRFLIQLMIASTIVAVSVLLIAQRKEDALKYGFFGKTGSCQESSTSFESCDTCQWDRGVPWLDFLFFRLNFWVGPMTCPIDNSFSAKLMDDYLLIENCDRSTSVESYFNGSVLFEFDGPAYSLLPRTETWGLLLKHDDLDSEQNAFQINVLKYVEEHTYSYLEPTKLDADTNAVIARCGNAQPKVLRNVGVSATHKQAQPSEQISSKSEDRLNVITIFVDSVSRAHFHRMMPLTRQVIESSVKGLGNNVYEMFRYHTVGSNTGPNTRAMWAGLDEHDKHTAGVAVWEQFEKAGYTGGRIDPMCQDWDAYYGTSYLEQVANTTFADARISHEYISWSCLPPYLKLGKNANGNFDGAYALTARCISDTHVGWHALDYASDFVAQYSSQTPFYLHSTFMEAHEGSGAVLGTLDSALAAFLDPAQGSPINYANTAIVIAADHGALMGLRSVAFDNGRVEAASPFGVFILPGAWTERNGRAARLEHATRQLVTGFDFYETIRGFGGDALITDRSPIRRGVDLAREVVDHGTCADAGIAQEMCKCN